MPFCVWKKTDTVLVVECESDNRNGAEVPSVTDPGPVMVTLGELING